MLLDNMSDLNHWLWRLIFAETMPHNLVCLPIDCVEILRRSFTRLAKPVWRLYDWFVLSASLVNNHVLILLLIVGELIDKNFRTILDLLVYSEIIANFHDRVIYSLYHLLSSALSTTFIFYLNSRFRYSRWITWPKINWCLLAVKIRYIFERSYWPINKIGLRFLRILWLLRCAKWIEWFGLNFCRVTAITIRHRVEWFTVNYYAAVDWLNQISC